MNGKVKLIKKKSPLDIKQAMVGKKLGASEKQINLC